MKFRIVRGKKLTVQHFYIQIGRLEIFLCEFDVSYMSGPCKCKILSLGWFGLTLLSGDCV